jgi:hypothetical protein
MKRKYTPIEGMRKVEIKIVYLTKILPRSGLVQTGLCGVKDYAELNGKMAYIP